MAKMAFTAVLLVAAAMAMASSPGSAQQAIPSCATSLFPCASYLNSTKPPESCCGPLVSAVKNDTACLCSLFNNTALLKTFNIDLNEVLRLPKACGIEANTTMCSKTVSSSPPSATPTSPSVAGTPPGNNSNSAHGPARIGMYGLVGLFLFSWSIAA